MYCCYKKLMSVLRFCIELKIIWSIFCLLDSGLNKKSKISYSKLKLLALHTKATKDFWKNEIFCQFVAEFIPQTQSKNLQEKGRQCCN